MATILHSMVKGQEATIKNKVILLEVIKDGV